MRRYTEVRMSGKVGAPRRVQSHRARAGRSPCPDRICHETCDDVRVLPGLLDERAHQHRVAGWNVASAQVGELAQLLQSRQPPFRLALPTTGVQRVLQCTQECDRRVPTQDLHLKCVDVRENDLSHGAHVTHGATGEGIARPASAAQAPLLSDAFNRLDILVDQVAKPLDVLERAARDALSRGLLRLTKPLAHLHCALEAPPMRNEHKLLHAAFRR
eukprot:scaffold62393_cov31-Tisochrysis_lutea.AAC.3